MARQFPSPTTPIPTLRRALLWLLLTLVPLAAAAGDPAKDGPKPVKPGDPYLTIPLDTFGFGAIPPEQLVSGATFFTVHFVDPTHILLTYNAHGLIPRINDGAPQDNDRLITALLLELPSGNVLARATWHTRDREQYLWPLSHGLFMLRIKSQLTVIDPIHNLDSGDAFRQQAFLEMNHPIGYISVSPGGDLLVVETIVPPHPQSSDQSDQNATPGAPQVLHFNTEPTAEIHFFRMVFTAGSGDTPRLVAQNAGLLAARNLVRVTATAEGFLDIVKEAGPTWDFDFQSHAGKRLELAPFDTTCAPSPYFVSRTEFVALGCRGSDTSLMLSGFNLRGEQPWIQVLSGQQIAPMLVTAPDAGRFAFSRILMQGNYYDLQSLTPEEISGQDIQVLQHYDGRVLLHVRVLTVQRAGQNFDLSPDGLGFTVVRNGNLEIYQLPPLTSKDQAQIKLAAATQPEPTDARIRLTSNRPVAEASKAKSTPATEPVLTINAPTPVIETPHPNAGDAQPDDAPRAPPSLYGPDYPKNPKP